LADADFTQRRQLVELQIDRMLVTDGEVEICDVIPLRPDGERGHFRHGRNDYFDEVALCVEGLIVDRKSLCRGTKRGLKSPTCFLKPSYF